MSVIRVPFAWSSIPPPSSAIRRTESPGWTPLLSVPRRVACRASRPCGPRRCARPVPSDERARTRGDTAACRRRRASPAAAEQTTAADVRSESARLMHGTLAFTQEGPGVAPPRSPAACPSPLRSNHAPSLEREQPFVSRPTEAARHPRLHRSVTRGPTANTRYGDRCLARRAKSDLGSFPCAAYLTCWRGSPGAAHVWSRGSQFGR
jgi:DNA-binding transcriptional LysR family regulator